VTEVLTEAPKFVILF